MANKRDGRDWDGVTLWTIGHSTRSMEDLLSLLKSHGIQHVVDVRHYPGSRRYPHFNKESLRSDLDAAGIGYSHEVALGGRRAARSDSPNTAWKNASFRGYADYMATEDFQEGIDDLRKVAQKQPTAIMCSEAVWWRCHRSMIADELKSRGAIVRHIMNDKPGSEHPYTEAARLKKGKLSYLEDDPPARPAF